MKLARCVMMGSDMIDGVFRRVGSRFVMPMSRAIAYRDRLHIHSVYDAPEPSDPVIPKAGTSGAAPFEAQDRAIAKENVSVRKVRKKKE